MSSQELRDVPGRFEDGDFLKDHYRLKGSKIRAGEADMAGVSGWTVI